MDSKTDSSDDESNIIIQDPSLNELIYNRPFTRKYLYELSISADFRKALFEELTRLENKKEKLEEGYDKLKRDRKEFHDFMEKSTEESKKNLDEYVKDKMKLLDRVRKNSTGDEWIKINVGGKKFETRKGTLVNLGFYFVQLLDSKFTPTTDNEGIIFIDRDPTFFPVLLNYSRNGFNSDIFIPYYTDTSQRSCLIDELNYFGIDIDLNMDWPCIDDNIDVLWRGSGGKIYFGQVKKMDRSKNTITVKYADGEIWNYNFFTLLRSSGHYKNLVLDKKYNDVKFIHYQHAEQLK